MKPYSNSSYNVFSFFFFFISFPFYFITIDLIYVISFILFVFFACLFVHCFVVMYESVYVCVCDFSFILFYTLFLLKTQFKSFNIIIIIIFLFVGFVVILFVFFFCFVLLSRSNDGCFADLKSSCQVINLFTFIFFIIIL